MRPCAQRVYTVFIARTRPLWWIAVLLLATWAGKPVRAQKDLQAPPQNGAPYVLHLYARLVELPTMILFRHNQKSVRLEPQQVNIQLNSEPPFHPASLRPEGNDPLSIAILIDVSGDEPQHVSALQKHFSEWVSKSLRAQDHVSIYALDCDLIRTASDVPANPEVLQKALDAALTSTQTHGTSTKGACGNSIRIRGSILFVMQKLSQLPGRRTLILFDGGRDSKSEINWPQLNEAATISSVTVFGVTEPGPMEYVRIQNVYNLAQQSGGFLFSPLAGDVPVALGEIVSLLRTRYILQFPMPDSLSTKTYHVYVTVPKYEAVIRPSGISVPLPNPAVDHPATDLPSEAPEPPASPTQPSDKTTPPPAAPNR